MIVDQVEGHVNERRRHRHRVEDGRLRLRLLDGLVLLGGGGRDEEGGRNEAGAHILYNYMYRAAGIEKLR